MCACVRAPGSQFLPPFLLTPPRWGGLERARTRVCACVQAPVSRVAEGADNARVAARHLRYLRASNALLSPPGMLASLCFHTALPPAPLTSASISSVSRFSLHKHRN
eukprot:121123-Pleurochrysis_carterae.AAC.1